MTPPPLSRRIALATGLTYHALEWDGGDHTVVLLHGFLDLAWGWEEVAAALAGRFHVVAPDLRGHGDSDWIGAGGYYHFLDYIADVDELIARIGRGRVSIVGHSMGGSVASYVAGTRPERIHRVALLEGLGPPETTDPIPDRAARWLDGWRAARARPARRMKTVEEAAARLCKHDELLDPERALRLAQRGTIRDASGVRWKHDPLHLTMGPYPFRVDLAQSFWQRIRGPVLVVDGDRSRMRLADAELARRLAAFGDVKRATVAGAGHMMQRHQPAAVAALLADHLAG